MISAVLAGSVDQAVPQLSVHCPLLACLELPPQPLDLLEKYQGFDYTYTHGGHIF